MEGKTAVSIDDPTYAGQAGYTRSMLRMYDLAAFRFFMPVCWRCSVDDLVELYNKHASGRHLDIGVATGSLMSRCEFPVAKPEITLMDLNPSTLQFAARRLQRFSPRTHQADVLSPWGLPSQSFESVGMCNLLHCVPGTMREKAVAFQYARQVLMPGGCLFGSSVLVGEVQHTRLSRMVLKRVNKRGVFSNMDDSLEDLDAGLSEAFSSHRIEVHGAMALFVARAGEISR